MYKYLLKFSSWIHSLTRKRNRKLWLEVKEKLTTPHLITSYYRQEGFKYVEDGRIDNMLRPDCFIVAKQGDCEDFANFAYTCLKYHGWKCYIYGIWKTHLQGHAICIVEYGDAYMVISNMKVTHGYKTIHDCIIDVYPGCSVMVERLKW